jgi:GNAT superfamily N-acetyltransferase
MQLREAGSADVEALVELAAAQLAEHALPFERDELRRTVRDALGNDRGLWLLALGAQGSAIGFAYLPFLWSLEHGGRVAWLEEMYVVESSRNRGVGAALVREACARTAAIGCKAIDLEVDDTHSRAERLYQREGFRRLDRTRWVLTLPSRSP